MTLLDDFSSVATPCTSPRSRTIYIWQHYCTHHAQNWEERTWGIYIYDMTVSTTVYLWGVVTHRNTVHTPSPLTRQKKFDSCRAVRTEEILIWPRKPSQSTNRRNLKLMHSRHPFLQAVKQKKPYFPPPEKYVQRFYCLNDAGVSSIWCDCLKSIESLQYTSKSGR